MHTKCNRQSLQPFVVDIEPPVVFDDHVAVRTVELDRWIGWNRVARNPDDQVDAAGFPGIDNFRQIPHAT